MAAGLIFVSLFFRLGGLPLLAPDEGRNAEIAREMKDSRAWLVPTYNRLDRLDKPAFFFKTVAFALAVFGENETATRLPSALAALALAAVVYAFTTKASGKMTGLMTAIIVATTPLYIANARTVILDMELALFTCGAIFAGYLAETVAGIPRRNWYLLGAGAAGVATLIKGPVGFVIPVLVLLVHNHVERRRDAWKRLFAALNVVVFFAITLPWFIGLCVAHPDFLRYGLVEESFRRFTSAQAFHRSEPFYFYILIILGMFFPWSLLLPEATLGTWQRRWKTTPADRFCIVWALVAVAFFSVSASKLPGYILSVVMPSAFLTARLFSAALTSPESRPTQLVNRGAASFAVICFAVAVVLIAGRTRAALLAKPLHMNTAAAVQLSDAAIPLATALLVLGGIASLARTKRSSFLAFVSMSLLAPAGIIMGLKASEVIYGAKSYRQLADSLAPVAPGVRIVCLQCMPSGLSFYLRHTPVLISKDGHELTSNYLIYFLARNPWPTDKIVPLDQFDAWLGAQRSPIHLIASRAERSRLEALAEARHLKVEHLPQAFFGLQLPAPGPSLPDRGS